MFTCIGWWSRRTFVGTVRPLWLSAGHRAAVAGRLGRQPFAGGTDLKAGGPEGAAQAAQAWSAMVGRWVVHPASTDTSQPCVELGLRDGPDGRRPADQDPDVDRRVYEGSPGDLCRATHPGQRCDRHL